MNQTEYCQTIYEAAKQVVEFYYGPEMGYEREPFLLEMDRRINNLKQALDGKEA